MEGQAVESPSGPTFGLLSSCPAFLGSVVVCPEAAFPKEHNCQMALVLAPLASCFLLLALFAAALCAREEEEPVSVENDVSGLSESLSGNKIPGPER